MRDLTHLPNCVKRLLNHPYGTGDAHNGVFVVRLNGSALRVIASDGMGWDHVSVSLTSRCPTWEEMAAVKRLFFQDHEPAFQVFPPADRYVNDHPFCLHWWRSQNVVMPMPDLVMV